jgi:hypothetical protein
MRRDWIFAAAGPLAWFIAHVASWMLTPGAHETAGLAALYAIDAAALVVAVTAGAGALGRLRSLGRAAPADRHVQRARFLALSGLGLSGMSIVLIIGLAAPYLLLLPGAEP